MDDAINALGNIGSLASPAGPMLVDILYDTELPREYREEAAIALGKIGFQPSKIVPFLIEQIEVERIEAILMDRGDEPLDDGIHYLDAIFALGFYGAAAAEAVPALTTLLNSVSDDELTADNNRSYLSLVAIGAVGNIGFSDSETISVLKEMVQKTPISDYLTRGVGEPAIPCAAATALGKQGSEVESAAYALTSHEDLYVRILASHILVNFRPEALEMLTKNLRLLSPENVNTTTIEDCFDGVTSKGVTLKFSSRVSPLLATKLNEGDEATRIFSAYSLGAMDNVGDEAMYSLTTALNSDSAAVRTASAKALKHLGLDAQSASEALFLSIGDPTDRVSYQAALGFLAVNTFNSNDLLFSIEYGLNTGGRFSDLFRSIHAFFEDR